MSVRELPDTVIDKAKMLAIAYKEHVSDKKSYCKMLSRLIEPHLSIDVLKSVQNMHDLLLFGEIEEDVGLDKIISILLNAISKQSQDVLELKENIPDSDKDESSFTSDARQEEKQITENGDNKIKSYKNISAHHVERGESQNRDVLKEKENSFNSSDNIFSSIFDISQQEYQIENGDNKYKIISDVESQNPETLTIKENYSGEDKSSSSLDTSRKVKQLENGRHKINIDEKITANHANHVESQNKEILKLKEILSDCGEDKSSSTLDTNQKVKQIKNGYHETNSDEKISAHVDSVISPSTVPTTNKLLRTRKTQHSNLVTTTNYNATLETLELKNQLENMKCLIDSQLSPEKNLNSEPSVTVPQFENTFFPRVEVKIEPENNSSVRTSSDFILSEISTNCNVIKTENTCPNTSTISPISWKVTEPESKVISEPSTSYASPKSKKNSSKAINISSTSSKVRNISSTSSKAINISPPSLKATSISHSSSKVRNISPTNSEIISISSSSSDAKSISPTNSEVKSISSSSSDSRNVSPTKSEVRQSRTNSRVKHGKSNRSVSTKRSVPKNTGKDSCSSDKKTREIKLYIKDEYKDCSVLIERMDSSELDTKLSQNKEIRGPIPSTSSSKPKPTHTRKITDFFETKTHQKIEINGNSTKGYKTNPDKTSKADKTDSDELTKTDKILHETSDLKAISPDETSAVKPISSDETSVVKTISPDESTSVNTDLDDKKRKRVYSENDFEEKAKKLMEVIKVEAGNDQRSFDFIRITPTSKLDRCNICRQFLLGDDLKLYNGHPNNAQDEIIALTDSKLMLFTGDESVVDETDQRPVNRITNFSVYDRAGHLCHFDTGLIEANKLLYFSGYIKPIYDDNPDAEGGVPAKDMGPILEWFISGFDGGEKALLGFSTEYGEYYLMEPSEEYSSFMKLVKEKTFMAKIVIEFLQLECWQNPTYEDLLNYLQITVPPSYIGSLNEEHLLRHAQFVCDQVTNFEAGSSDEDLLIDTPCMRALIKLAGVTFGKRKAIRNKERGIRKKSPVKWSKATTTPLVQQVFESFFPEQLDTNKELTIRRKRCGVCEACQQPDCGQCSKCRDMAKYGGSGRSKQACVLRRCPNMAVQEDDSDSGSEEAESESTNDESRKKDPICAGEVVTCETKWIGKSVISYRNRAFYDKAQIGDLIISSGDYIMLKAIEPTSPMVVAKIAYMFEDKDGVFFHAEFLCRGNDTILGKCAHARELFVSLKCDNLPLGSIIKKANVHYRSPQEWFFSEDKLDYHPEREDDGLNYYYQFRYDMRHGRFEDVPKTTNKEGYTLCRACEKLCDERTGENFKYHDKTVRWRCEDYTIGTGVYLKPDTFEFHNMPKKEDLNKSKQTVDESVYPEYYRKTSDNVKGSNNETSEPFCIGYILDVTPEKVHESKNFTDSVKILVQKLYRPENTHKGTSLSEQLGLNHLYWSEETCLIDFSCVTGKCYIVNADYLSESLDKWTLKGPNRFYFNECYDYKTKEFKEVSGLGANIGKPSKGKGVGKGLSKSSKKTSTSTNHPSFKGWPQIEQQLQIMDVFAGCGGLSEGLHQSGIGQTRWAIEQDEAAAKAFKLNNPDAMVYTEDCNRLLSLAVSGATHSEQGLALPQRGQVDLLCGGPPCQGFSGMNRFNAGQYSLFKNSLIVSYLSYCDYYRPRYFILENVRNFVSFKRSMVLKLTLRCLLAMGYQCTFGVLQAGSYGVPQTRRRVFILAAAPGCILPKYPEPTHVFNKRGMQLNVMVDEFKFSNGSKWTDSAPYRTITVRDAMSDLPSIRNGCSIEERRYDCEPLSHFQRLMRSEEQQLLQDHICKEMAPLVEARMAHIPVASGSDWRDLPNIVTRLSDGTFTKKLIYEHSDKKNGKSSTGALRGVCPCASGNPCDPVDRQMNTIIPWCLPHTANRHNHWAGLYGRLEWDGFFSTTVTNPEPMGKQGRVLHPEQNRVVSVRECARSQGFPDKYRFYGNVLDKHRQVGNAVPPPLGAAIGREILAAWSATEIRQKLPSVDLIMNSGTYILPNKRNVSDEESQESDETDNSSKLDVPTEIDVEAEHKNKKKRTV